MYEEDVKLTFFLGVYCYLCAIGTHPWPTRFFTLQGEVFKTAILKAAAPAQQAYTDAVEKYKEVMELNKSVEEVAQLFLDFALITEQQGELLDQIEFQVEAAAEYVSKGNEDMEEAIEIQKSIRQKMMWIIFAVVVLVVIVVGVTMGVQ